eukprot:2027549-Rhodomonas_salina.2
MSALSREWLCASAFKVDHVRRHNCSRHASFGNHHAGRRSRSEACRPRRQRTRRRKSCRTSSRLLRMAPPLDTSVPHLSLNHRKTRGSWILHRSNPRAETHHASVSGNMRSQEHQPEGLRLDGNAS